MPFEGSPRGFLFDKARKAVVEERERDVDGDGGREGKEKMDDVRFAEVTSDVEVPPPVAEDGEMATAAASSPIQIPVSVADNCGLARSSRGGALAPVISEGQDASSASLPPKPKTKTLSGGGGDGGRGRGKIAPFYFPRGKDADERENREWQAIGTIFDSVRTKKSGAEGLDKFEFSQVVLRTLALPSFFAWAVHKRVLLYVKSEEPKKGGGDGTSTGEDSSEFSESGFEPWTAGCVVLCLYTDFLCSFAVLPPCFVKA